MSTGHMAGRQDGRNEEMKNTHEDNKATKRWIMSSKRLQLVTGFLTVMMFLVAAIQSFAQAPITNASWISMGPNTNAAVYALAVYSNEIYAGGDFTEIGGEPASFIAKWDGSTWSALGTGMDGSVKAIAVDPATGDIYAGGYFTEADGASANCIAKWTRATSSWSALGTGMDGAFDIVNALAFDGTNLYAGGLFTTAGGVTVNNIAKWNGTIWSALGTGMDDEVYALALDGATILYAGGWFTDADGVAANCIAQYTIGTTTWSALGEGVDGPANVLVVKSGDLYAGGNFITADGISVNKIAKWDGSWSAIGTGMNNEVNSLGFDSSGILYAGGQFTSASGVLANRIAQWDGSTWNALGSGTNSSVRAIAFDPSDILYAGGNFTYAGLKATKYLAKCSTSGITVPGAPTTVVATPGNGQADINFVAPDDGGSAITLYTATSAPGGKVGTSTTTTVTVLGLTNGTAYTFKVTATNALGTGPASLASKAVKPGVVPGAPTIKTAVAGNEKAIVAFTAPLSNGGSVITSYTVISVTPDSNITVTRSGSAATPITVTGLTPGTSYTFVVVATNALGTSAASGVCNAVVPTATVPGAPTGVIAMRDDTQVYINFHPPLSNGGSAITMYTVYSGGIIVGTSASRPITITGLTNGKAYTFTVKATNAVGQGPASLASKAVIPAAPLTAIAVITGTTAAGQILTAGALTPAGATATYQWMMSADDVTYTDIIGARAKTYKLLPVHAGKYIKVEATGTLKYCETVTSAATAQVTAPITAMGAIVGTARVGYLLTAGALTPVGATATYQWKSAATSTGAYADIVGETGNTYTLVAGDLTRFIKVEATGSVFYTGSKLSLVKGPVLTTAITAMAAISGIPQVGVELTAGALTPSGSAATYQWKSSATVGGTYIDIAGATSNTYTPVADDAGKFIKVSATGTAGYTGTKLSAATSSVVAAPLTAIGAIAGTPQVGVLLTAGALTPAGATATYQWKSAATVGGAYSNIAGATSSTYMPVAGDLAMFIKVEATGTGGYFGAVLSAATATVTAAPITAIGAITGTVSVGSVLTSGALIPAGATATYQWTSSTTSGGIYVNIVGATASTYTLIADDAGDFIKVEATGTGGYSGTALSAATAAVAAPLTAIGAITGTAQVDVQLTAGALTPAGATATYQWKSAATVGGVYSDIVGATAATYTPVGSDAGKFIKVEATGTGIYSGTILSAATAAVADAPITAIAAIIGAPKVGVQLIAGALTPAAATATYQWQIADTAGGVYADILGATASTYTPVALDETKFIKVVATGSSGYSGTVTSAATTVVAAATVLGAVDLGTAGNFVILAKTTVTTTGTTAVLGDIGISPAAASLITGFGLIADAENQFSTSSLVTGNIYAADYSPPTPINMGVTIGDMETAYTDAAGRTLPDYTELYAGDVTGQNLTPGLYKWGTGVLISAGGVTITGSATDVWIFQIAQDLTVANGAIITLAGGAKAENIFWQVAGQTTLGTTAQMKGIILCQTQISMNTGATLDGRALAQTAVTLISNNVNTPTPIGTDATVTSGTYTVSPVVGGAGTIINVPAGTSKVVFLATLTKGQVNQTWNTQGVATTVLDNDILIVTSQDKLTVVTYTITTP